ncbi:MAG TPA: hypothetical protein VI386_17685 [Candidatus Sulfotelmatobacter sp.]
MSTRTSLFDKINSGFSEPPLATGPNVFITSEYAAAIGLSEPQTFRRVKQLLAEGKVARVRVRRNGRVVPGWKYVGAR